MKNFYFFLLVISLISCKSDKNSENQELDAVLAESSIAATSCFKDYNGKLDELLTKEDIKKVYELDLASAEMEYEKEYSPVYYQSMVYS